MQNMVTKAPEANQIDIVFDCYTENSIKRATEAPRSNDVEPIEHVNLLLESYLPVGLERFWDLQKTRKKYSFYHVHILNRKPNIINKPYFSSKWICY